MCCYVSVLKTAGLRTVSRQVRCEKAGVKGKRENIQHGGTQQTETNDRFLSKKRQRECLILSKHSKSIPIETELMKINTQKKTEIKS